MKQYSFSISKPLLEQFKKSFPSHRAKKIMKKFIVSEYQLPVDIRSLENSITDSTVQPYWMSDDEISKFDLLIEEAKNKGYSLNRSILMRDVMENLIERSEEYPSEKSDQHRQPFKVPAGTKMRLRQLIEEKGLAYEISLFIMDGYTPSGDFPSMRSADLEDLTFQADIEVFEEMDRIAQSYDFKKGGRAKIFRDALIQLEDSLQPLVKVKIKQELNHILTKYSAVEDRSVILDEVASYLNKK